MALLILNAESVLIGLGISDSHDDEGWKLLSSGTRKTSPAPPAHVQDNN